MKRTENKYVYFDKPRIINIKYCVKSIIYPFLNFIYKLTYNIIPFRKQIDAKYDISICAIFKNESQTLKEWIEFHRIIGVEHFYLYNNNSTDDYLEILMPYIDLGIVTLIDWPTDKGQFTAYMNWYETYRKETQWVTFLDLDEFICPINQNNIKDWIKKRKRYPVIQMYWRMFTSSGLIEHDNKKLNLEQYVVCSDKLMDIGKVFYNTSYDIYKPNVSMMHSFKTISHGIVFYPVNEFGNIFMGGLSKFKKINSIQINHYWGRALNLYLIKKQRGSATGLFQKSFEHFMDMEYMARTSDYKIFKYLIPLKLKMNNINF